MYVNNNVEAIRAIDRIIQTPKVDFEPKSEEMFSSTGKHVGYGSQPKNNLHKKSYFDIVEEASEALKQVSTELTFRVHEDTGRPVIKLVELGTDEVIREIPPEKMLDILAGIWEWAGLIIDRKE